MTNNSTDTPRTNNYYAGKGCECSARNRSECGCDVDWTDPRIYALEAEVEELKHWKDNLISNLMALEIYTHAHEADPAMALAAYGQWNWDAGKWLADSLLKEKTPTISS